jgi:phospholipid/cholesterol/gamma-HCH transport system substrate-binding protein
VYIAGVPVGKVKSIDRADSQRMRVTLQLDKTAAPVRQGATAQINLKALTGQVDVTLTQGTGQAYPSGSVLPASAVKPTVQLRDILASLNPQTRTALTGVIRSLGQSTDGREKDLSGVMQGFSQIGTTGHTTLQALSDQSADLEVVSNQLSDIWDALDVGRGQIAQLVSGADRLTAATTGQRAAVEQSMRKLPGVLDSATEASTDISKLGRSLRPVAADLRDAAPDLNASFNDLPDATHQLRDSLRPLHDVLHDAGPTLHRTDRFQSETDDFIPPATSVLKDLNPMLRYSSPYGHDVAAFFTNFGDAFHNFESDGQVYIRVYPVVGAHSARYDPVDLPKSVVINNPYPEPGFATKPLTSFTGKYPRVERDN